MTEEMWVAWDKDPGDLFNVVRNSASDRKLRLFACACVQQVAHLLTDERSARAVATAELFADGRVSVDEVSARHKDAVMAADDAAAAHGIFSSAEHIAVAAAYTLAPSGLVAFAAANRAAAAVGKANKALAQRAQCTLFRDAFGNPYRPITPAARWLSFQHGAIPSLAGRIYDGHSFDHLPLLAEMLSEAGCDDAAMLTHCRSEGPHATGCWVVDLILGRR